MLPITRRSIAALSLVLLFAPTIAGCASTQYRPFTGTRQLDGMTGVTTLAGRKIAFVEPGAMVTNDTLYAVGKHGQLILPTDSIANVWNRKVSPGRTIGLVAGIAALTVVIAGAVAFGNTNLFPGY